MSYFNIFRFLNLFILLSAFYIAHAQGVDEETSSSVGEPAASQDFHTFMSALSTLGETSLSFEYLPDDDVRLQHGKIYRLSWRQNIEVSSLPEKEGQSVPHPEKFDLTVEATTQGIEYQGQPAFEFPLEPLSDWAGGVYSIMDNFTEELAQKGYEWPEEALFGLSFSLVKLEKKTWWSWTPVKSLFAMSFGDNLFSEGLQELWDWAVSEDSSLCILNDSTIVDSTQIQREKAKEQAQGITPPVGTLRCNDIVALLDFEELGSKIEASSCNRFIPLFEHPFLKINLYKPPC